MGKTRRRKNAKRPTIGMKSILFAGGGLVIAAALALALTPLLNGPRQVDRTPGAIVISMAGFSPDRVAVSAGQPVTLTLINPDSQFHTDGGGWHQFSIDELNIDVRVAPKSQQTVSLGPLAAGRYEFYCDVCCGGRANPSMIGILEVTG